MFFLFCPSFSTVFKGFQHFSTCKAWNKLPEKLTTSEDKDKEWDDAIGFLRP